MNNDMNEPSQIEIALEIALKAHKGQRDLDGKPVILHPLTVAMKGNNENEIVAGLLHDVVEDTDYTFEDLLAAGISSEVVDALRLLTHEKGSEYLDYVRRIAEGSAWDLLIGLPGEGKYWQAKFAFQIEKKPIEEATAEAGITIDEYMHFFHPDRTQD